MRVVLRLATAEESPTLDELAEALDRPARPLFLGRKSCLPSAPLLAQGSDRWVVGDTAYAALRAVPGTGKPLRALWPVGEGPEEVGDDIGDDISHIADLADLRNWRTGLHSGSRLIVEGRITPVQAE